MIPPVIQPGDTFQRIRMPDDAGVAGKSLSVVSVSGNLIQLEWVVAKEYIDTTNDTRIGYFELSDGDLEWVTQQGVNPEIRDDVVLLSAMQAALDLKQNTLVSATNIKTVNGATLLGSGDLTVSGGLGTSFTKAQLDTAISDGNGVYVGDALNGSLGATTPSTVACTTVNASGVVTATATGTHTFGTTNNVTMTAGNIVSVAASGDNLRVTGGGSTWALTGESDRVAIIDRTAGARVAWRLNTGAGWTFAGSSHSFRNAVNSAYAPILVSNITADGFLVVGSGTAVLKILSATATLDFGSIAANSFEDLTITVTGAAVGNTVSIGVPNGSLVADLSFFGWVSATNTVTIRCVNNSSTTARDPASGTFRATLIQF